MELGAREPRAVVLSADTQDLLGIRTYIERYPERFLELGIAEQNTIGVAPGLATTGLRPYVCAYAPFITARSMEQVIGSPCLESPIAITSSQIEVIYFLSTGGINLKTAVDDTPSARKPRG